MIYRSISELHELEGNPRFIKDDDFQKLCKSISDNPEYFEARPLILSNRTGKLVILAGNQRYKAAKHIGLGLVPTYLIEGLSEEKEREIIIRDNVSNGQWDFDILANAWDELELIEWGVEIPFIESFEQDSENEEPKPLTITIEFHSLEYYDEINTIIKKIVTGKEGVKIRG